MRPNDALPLTKRPDGRRRLHDSARAALQVNLGVKPTHRIPAPAAAASTVAAAAATRPYDPTLPTADHETSMPADDKPKGPAAYFPSIEKTYGRPIAHWLDLARSRAGAGVRHTEVVSWLKTEHGLGHGHANAIVAHVLAESR